MEQHILKRRGGTGEHFRKLAECLDEGIISLDRDLHVTYANPRAAAFLGSATGGLSGKPLGKSVAATFAHTLESTAARVIDMGEAASFEGACGAHRLSCRVLPSEDGATVMLREAEERLRLSEQRFLYAFDTSPTPMSISDLETGTYTDVNAAFLSVTGFTRDEVIGKSSLELGFWVNPDDRKTLVAGTITKGYPTGVELKMRVKGGQVRAVVIWTRVMDVGGTKHLFTVAKDVTDEEAPGRKIRESEERLRSLADNLPQVAVYRLRYSPENPPRFEYLSAGIERIVGISPEKAMKDASFLYRLVEHDDLMGLMAAEAHSHANATPLECEIRMRHAVTGTTAWVVLRATHLRTKEGCTVWSGVMVDVTEKKMAEHDLLPVDYNCCL